MPACRVHYLQLHPRDQMARTPPMPEGFLRSGTQKFARYFAGVSHRAHCVDHLGVKRGETIRNMGVKSDTRITPITRVYLGRALHARQHTMTVPIRREGSSFAPVRC